MTEEMLIENKNDREKLIDRIDVLEKVKKLLLISGTEHATVKQVAEFYEVGNEAISSLVKDNRNELEEDGLLTTSGKETKAVLGKSSENFANYRGYFVYDGIVFNNRSNLLFPRRAILRVGMLLRDSKIAKEVRTQLLNIEENSNTDQKIKSIQEEEQLLLDVAKAFASGDMNNLMIATSKLNAYKDRYIKTLEPKAKYYDEVIKKGDAVTSTIWTRIRDSSPAQRTVYKTEKLGARTIAVLDYVHEFINHHGYCPSIREIGKGIGVSSTSTVQIHMNKLNDLGLIVKNPKETRNTRVNEEEYVKVMCNLAK